MWDQNTKEIEFIEKIENEIDEKLYDLLVQHIKNSEHLIINNKERYVEVLEKGINKLKNEVNTFNKLQYYRYIIIVCNKILRLYPDKKNIKELKKSLISDYIHSNENGDIIPLNYQINELRITYDADYIKFLINKFYNNKDYNKCLYCLIAAQIIEPDNEELENIHKEILSKIKKNVFREEYKINPKNKVLALDSNVVFSRIFYDVDDYKIPHTELFNIELFGNYNKFIITPNVKKETELHLKYNIAYAENFCKYNKKYSYKKIKEVLEKRFNKIFSKYGIENYNLCEVKVDDLVVETMRDFYNEYLDVLEKIVLEKIKNLKFSQKLKKLAHRDSLLPEKGDIILLAEVYELKKTIKNIAILSDDKDLTVFSNELEKNWGIEVYSKIDYNA